MTGPDKIKELEMLRFRVVELEQAEAQCKRAEAAERKQRALAEALCEIAAALNSSLKLDEVLDLILANVGQVVPHDAANIMLIESGAARVVRCQGYAERGLEEALLSARFQVSDLPRMRELIEGGQATVVVDTQKDDGWVATPESRWVRSLIGVPICLEERVIGIINIDSATPGLFTFAHAERLQAFADQAAVAIRNARLYEQAQRNAAELEERVAERTLELQTTNARLLAQIAEREQAEEALRESEERYRNLFDNSLSAFALHEIVTDDEGRSIDYIFLEVNRAFEEQTGLTADQVIGKRVTEALPGIEDDPFIEIYGQVALTGEPTRFEQFASPLNKTYLIAAFSPRKGQFATTFTDITERKQAEEAEREQRTLAEALRDTAAALNSTLDLDEVIDRILANVERVVPHGSARRCGG